MELTEFCLVSDFQPYQEWNWLRQILLIPDLGRLAFLVKAVDTGSALTLVTFAIQEEMLGNQERLQLDLIVCRWRRDRGRMREG